MSARSKARKRALDVLYEADLREIGARDVLTAALSVPDRPLNQYTIELVEGVVDHQQRIDELLGTYSEGWTLERMPPVDRNVLRIGVWELLYADQTPDAVAISEAVALVQDLSTGESATFVNGLLARVVTLKQDLGAE
ncbi:MAG: transcription antitermination factor NusB [Candidatus Nanopelagicales bacterium]